MEESLNKIINPGGVIEDVQEELVDFYDWMVDADHPNGIIVTDEMELIRQHPEYLTLTEEEPPTKQQKTSGAAPNGEMRAIDTATSASAVNTPIVTDIGSEAESQAGRESAQRSPAFAPTPSPVLSAQDDDVDDLEDDILGAMEEKPAPEPGMRLFVVDACANDGGSDQYVVRFHLRTRSSASVPDESRIPQVGADEREASEVLARRGARCERVPRQGGGKRQHYCQGASWCSCRAIELSTNRTASL